MKLLLSSDLVSRRTSAPMACRRHCGLCLAAAVTARSHGLAESLWLSTGLLAAPAGSYVAWTGAFLHSYVRHDAPGDGYQGIYQLLAAISGLKHIAS